jgi:rhodanese-related sulfurtransferase
MDGSKPPSLSPQDLYSAIGVGRAPLVLDVRHAAAFDADQTPLVGALRRDPSAVESWRNALPKDLKVLVYCAHGQEVSQGAAIELRDAGIEAYYLEGGIAGWVALGLPRRNKTQTVPNEWVTRERPKIDRIACPWLIRRFIDSDAKFLYAPTEKVFDVARETGAIAYDIPGAEPFSHDGELCSFDAFLKVYGIEDPALDALAVIVRGADTARLELAPQSPGLLALSLGLSVNFADDHEMLEAGMVMYDAIYAWCRSAQGQGHDWNPAAMTAAMRGAR